MTTFLIYLAIALAIIAIAQVVRIFELSSNLKGGQPNYVVKPSDNKAMGMLFLVFCVAFFIFCFWQFFEYKDRLLPVAASEEGVELDWLMNFNLIIITVVSIVVNFLLFFFAYKYAGSPDRKALYYPENHRLELLWTIVPGIALVVIIVLGIRSWEKMTRDPRETKEDYMLVELIAEQFSWAARFSGDDNELGLSDFRLISEKNVMGVDSTSKASWDDFAVRNEIHIPKGRRVMFVFRSKDVIHSAYFPHFRQQMNCVPGMQTLMHFMPTITTTEMRKITKNDQYNYILLCNKICGKSHFNMQMNVVVDEPDSFKVWYDKNKTKALFMSNVIKSNVDSTALSGKDTTIAGQDSLVTGKETGK